MYFFSLCAVCICDGECRQWKYKNQLKNIDLNAKIKKYWTNEKKWFFKKNIFFNIFKRNPTNEKFVSDQMEIDESIWEKNEKNERNGISHGMCSVNVTNVDVSVQWTY